MASKRKTSDEDVAEVGLVPDPDDDEMAEGFSIADADGESLDDDIEDDEAGDDEEVEGFEVDEDAIIEDVEAVIAQGDDSAPAAVTVVGAVVVAEDASVQIVSDDDDDEVEGIRPGIDFICGSCHLVKRTSQLAKRSKTKGPICRSCV